MGLFPAATLNLSDAFGQMLDLLQGIRHDVQALQRDEPPQRHDPEVQHYILSDTDARTNVQATLPSNFHILGLIVGADAAGRAVVTVNDQPYPIWCAANTSVVIDWGKDGEIIARNGVVKFTKPGGTHWDVIVFGRPSDVNMRGATQRV